MRATVAEMQAQSTQKILEDMQESLLPLLDSLHIETDPIHNANLETFRHESDLGSLVVFHSFNSLTVRVSEPFRMTPKPVEVNLEPIRLEAKFIHWLGGTIEPSGLFDPLSVAVFMNAENAPLSTRYVPYHWSDGGTSLESDRYGSLPRNDINRLRESVDAIVEAATPATVIPLLLRETVADMEAPSMSRLLDTA